MAEMFSSQTIFKDYFTNENYRFPHLLTDAGKLHVIAYYLMLSYFNDIQKKTQNILCCRILTINLSLLTKKTISDVCPDSKGKKRVSRSSWPHVPYWQEFRKTWRSLLRTLKWKAISPLSFPSQTKLITNLEMII